MTTPTPQENITRFWSTVAPGYEAHTGNVPLRQSAEYAAWVKALSVLLPPAPAEVLDIATGTGFLATIAAGLGHRVTGIDLAESMLAEARANATSLGLNLTFALGDAVAPSLPPASYDALMCRHFIWTLREPETAFRNWRALLRPGGRVIAIDGFWFAGDQPAAEPTEPDPDDLFGQHYTARTRAALPAMALNDPLPVVEMFRNAGFDPVAMDHLTEVHALAEDPPGTEPWYVIVAHRP
jgi:ubiquinone/menaquinone biosynthesis C-methylase UbiE